MRKRIRLESRFGPKARSSRSEQKEKNIYMPSVGIYKNKLNNFPSVRVSELWGKGPQTACKADGRRPFKSYTLPHPDYLYRSNNSR